MALNTFNGPMQKEKKLRAKPVRQVKEDIRNATTTKCEVLDNQDEETDIVTEATVKRQRILKETVAEVSENKNPFNILELLVDPVDDVQTVENIFDFSFLLKEKRVVIDISKETGRQISIILSFLLFYHTKWVTFFCRVTNSNRN